ncbi:MAG: hypothetical protein IT204_09610 [Fimbriimonadaceae bacterium]|nr:hypothetical protein [Fimbriimonadaceae bacterium]
MRWLLLTVTLAASGAGAALTDPPARWQELAAAQERLWTRVQVEPPVENSTRDLFAAALIYCEANTNLDRCERLFQVAAAEQDRTADSPTLGNFTWYLRDDAVTDLNSVEFCMQNGTVVWIRHRDRLSARARELLEDLLRRSISGCTLHRVQPTYTNIALMNASNLILLGEQLGDAAATAEGYARLDEITATIAEVGVSEYNSPTYTGVDLEDLVLLERFGQRPAGKQAARALLGLFWRTLAANWWLPAEKLAGARSRDYDYLRGLGMLDNFLYAEGWLPLPQAPRSAGLTAPLLAAWHPDSSLLTECRTKLPRYVRQRWGDGAAESMANYLTPDICLSSAGANYGNMDIPLSLDFAGPRTGVRGYFIPDGRHDPYGKLKIAAGPHQKTLHLRPFWAAAQERRDVLALVVYRPRDLPAETQTLESHFVLPRALDQVWVGDREVTLRDGQAQELPLASGQALVVRRGTAVAGIRVLWATTRDGRPAQAALVDDANDFGAVRLTVTHQAAPPATPGSDPGALLWVRVGSGLDTAGVAAFRQQFAAALHQVQAGPGGVQAQAAGLDGPLALAAAAPWNLATLQPEPCRVPLEVESRDLAGPLLADLPPVRAAAQELANLRPFAVTPAGTVWEAEAGAVRRPMLRATDPACGGGQYVWRPGPVGGKGGGRGSVAWMLDVPAAGRWHLWARVLAPTPDDDSFYLAATTAQRPLLDRTDWPLGTQPAWAWVVAPVVLDLPAGAVQLELSVREDGTKVDRLFVTSDAARRPPAD